MNLNENQLRIIIHKFCAVNQLKSIDLTIEVHHQIVFPV